MPITEADQDGHLRIRLQHSKCVFLLNLFTHALKIHLLRASYVLGSVQGPGDVQMAEAMKALLGLGGQQTPTYCCTKPCPPCVLRPSIPKVGGGGHTLVTSLSSCGEFHEMIHIKCLARQSPQQQRLPIYKGNRHIQNKIDEELFQPEGCWEELFWCMIIWE